MNKLAQNKLDAPFVAPGDSDPTSRMLQASGAGLAGALATKQPLNPRVVAATQGGAVGAQGVREAGGDEASAQIAGLLVPAATIAVPAMASSAAQMARTPFNPRLSAEKRINESAGKDKSAREKIAQALLERKQSELGSPVTSMDAIAEANVASPERFGGGLVRLQSELARHPASSDRARTVEKAQDPSWPGDAQARSAGAQGRRRTAQDSRRSPLRWHPST